MDSSTLSANASSIARLVAGIVGGVLTSAGVSTDSGTIETVMALCWLVAVTCTAVIGNVVVMLMRAKGG